MKTEDTKTEKEKVMEYVASLAGLDRYVSDDIDLLPEKLYAQALNYWKYEYEVEQVRENGKATPQELETMQSVSEIMKKNLDQDLQDLLRKYGYRFGEPDSLQNNVRQRLTDLREEYNASEGQEATPLLVDAWCVMKDDPKKREFRMTFQFDGKAIDDDNITMVNGTDALIALAGPDNGESYSITQVMNMYGNVYNVEITECLLAQETVQAKNRQEATTIVEDMLDNETLVLDEQDFNGVEIKLQEEKSSFSIQPSLIAMPDNRRFVSILEFLVKTVQKEGKNRDDAVDAVERDWKDAKIVLGEEDFAYRAISPAYQLVDNSQELPKRLFPTTQHELQQQFRNRFPDGVTVHLRKESVEHLLELDHSQGQELVGLVNDAENTLLPAYGELQAEVRLPGGDYRGIWPDAKTYFCKEFEKVLDRGQNTATTFLHYHPHLTGGRVSIDFTTAVRDSLYIEGIPFEKAVGLIRSEGISTDQEFKQAAGRLRQESPEQEPTEEQHDDRQRISDISVIRGTGNKAFIRCKVDGLQQGSVALTSKDRIFLENGMKTKEELALSYYRQALDRSESENRERGFRR